MSKFSPAAILYDLASHALRVAQDGTDYVLTTLSKIAQKESDSSFQYLKTNSDGSLKATLYDIQGNPIAFAAGTSNPALYVNPMLKLDGTGSTDMRVDGSSTAKKFQLLPDPSKDYAINSITLVMVNSSLTFGSDKFGAVNKLTNGVKVSLTSGGTEGIVSLLRQNEDFLHVATPGGFDLITANTDVLFAIISLGGAVILHAGSSDKVEVTIQDNLTSVGNYFAASVKGIKEE